MTTTTAPPARDPHHGLAPVYDEFAAVGCDRSAEMLEIARANLGGRAELLQADMRSLPTLGRFDVVACLDDGLNHLDTLADVGAALAGMAANLAPRGVVVFD